MKVEMRNINKSFYGVPVLKNINFDLIEGEVHGLVGENGAGKSTLMKILTGIYSKDSGQVLIDGKEVNIKNINDARDLDIAIVHQELATIKHMTIWENMFLGREIRNKVGIIDDTKMKSIAKEKLSEIGLEIDIDSLMGELTIAKQQIISIAMALLWNKQIIILDEPTSSLTYKEIEVLFKTIRDLKEKKVSFIYITHRLEEISLICDRITVLRDGAIIDTLDVTKTSISDMIKLMVGYQMHSRFPEINHVVGDVILRVKDLSVPKLFSNVSFELHKGEILGFSGLVGSGRTEVMQTIFGIIGSYAGTIEVEAKKIKIKSPLDAKKQGIAYITENRKEEGLILDFSITDNMVLPNLKAIINKIQVIDSKKAKNITEQYVKKLNIKVDHTDYEIKTLSGGNQQKVVVGKWLSTAPKILILDEPTRGVDVGAKYEIYEMIKELKESGVAIIMVSSEMIEVIGMSDRVVVMHEGKIKGVLSHEELSQEKIMTLATGGEV